MSIEIRKDFEGAGPGLFRLVVLAETFADNDDEWSHLINREDFADIYQMPRPIKEAFEKVYAEGRELGGAMARDLVAFNDPRRYPTLGSYLAMMDKWMPHLAGVEAIDRAAHEAESGVTVPWAARRMLALFDRQLDMFREALRVAGRLRESSLFLWETGATGPVRSDASPGRAQDETKSGSDQVAPSARASVRKPTPVTVGLLYAHESPEHKAWVKALADRLSSDGFHVMFDQYDLGPGDDISAFMERLVTEAQYKVAVCSDGYVGKVDAQRGGAGYEKSILARELMKAQSGADVIAILRNNTLDDPTPLFMGSRLYIDFRDDSAFEENYAVLRRKLEGLPPAQRPLPSSALTIGASGFGTPSILQTNPPATASSGSLVFNYGDNDGFFAIEAGGEVFDTKWSSASNDSIHAYRDGRNIDGIALADEGAPFEQIVEPGQERWSSRVRTARVGEIVLWRKKGGALLATRVDHVEARSHGSRHDVLTLTFHLVRAPS